MSFSISFLGLSFVKKYIAGIGETAVYRSVIRARKRPINYS
jgi:hypothetical protein